MFLSIGMLKQKYFLTDIFILSAEKQPIKLSWRKIEWLRNVVGNNRPDVQFDYNGVHTNVEYDTRTHSMEKHKKQLPKNDPNARNKFYKINDK